MDTRELQGRARILAEAARRLSANGQPAAALTAGILSRISASESLLDSSTAMVIDSTQLTVQDPNATYAQVLDQFTSIIARSHSNAGQAMEYASLIQPIDLPGQVVELDENPAFQLNPGVLVQLATRMADDGFPLEAGRALSAATVALWKQSHQEQYPQVPGCLIDQVTTAILEALDLDMKWAGHSDVWQALQNARFTPQLTPTPF